MLDFITTKIELGDIRENTTQTITFTAREDIPPHVSLSSSCGCSQPELQGKRNVVVTYKTGRISQHLRQQGYMHIAKKIFIRDVYTQEVTTLTFTGTII